MRFVRSALAMYGAAASDRRGAPGGPEHATVACDDLHVGRLGLPRRLGQRRGIDSGSPKPCGVLELRLGGGGVEDRIGNRR
jgi:hypothetical protein